MLVKKLIPFKFLSAMLQISIVGVLLSTRQIYPTLNNSSQLSFIIGCIFVILFLTFQVIVTIIGTNIYNRRIQFQNLVFNLVGLAMLVWSALGSWQRQYIWFIWALLTVYPSVNEILGLVSMSFHTKKVVFQKFRQED